MKHLNISVPRNCGIRYGALILALLSSCPALAYTGEKSRIQKRQNRKIKTLTISKFKISATAILPSPKGHRRIFQKEEVVAP